MNLIPRKHQPLQRGPFEDLLGLQSQMNRLFDFSLGRWSDDADAFRENFWAPAVDISDGKDSLTVKADLPGLKKEEIDISIHDGVLVIKGEKKSEEEQKGKGYLRSERFYGAFARQITLPSSVDDTKIKASYKDGVLELVLPKKEEAKPKQIKIDVN